jgi:hypothetical protein
MVSKTGILVVTQLSRLRCTIESMDVANRPLYDLTFLAPTLVGSDYGKQNSNYGKADDIYGRYLCVRKI